MSRRTKLPKVLDEEEQAALLDGFNTRYWTPQRDRTAVLTMLDAGLRVSEACGLEVQHLSLDTSPGKLTVRGGKGDVDRIVPLTERLADVLAEWLERRPEALESDTDALFPTRAGKAIHPNQLRRSVKRAAERAELDEHERISPHTLRHTAAVDLLRDTGRLEIVRNFLGHASVQTTEIYARLVNGELEEAVSSFREEEEAADGPDVEALADAIANLDPEARKVLARALEA